MNEDTREANYYRIGSFIIAGIILLVGALIIFGSGTLFQRTTYVETYFNESIQGLSEGSLVKYRGFAIGHVDKISFVSDIYKTHLAKVKSISNRYIYVRLAITSNFLSNHSDQTLNGFVINQIRQGLRIRLALQGLTGNAYLDFNFVDPKSNPPLAIDWIPKYYYIPSTPSTLTRFSENAQHIMEEFRKVDFKTLFNDLHLLSDSTYHVMQKTNQLLANTHLQTEKVMGNLQYISNNIRELSDQTKNYPSQLLFSKPPPELDPEKL